MRKWDGFSFLWNELTFFCTINDKMETYVMRTDLLTRDAHHLEIDWGIVTVIRLICSFILLIHGILMASNGKALYCMITAIFLPSFKTFMETKIFFTVLFSEQKFKPIKRLFYYNKNNVIYLNSIFVIEFPLKVPMASKTA